MWTSCTTAARAFVSTSTAPTNRSGRAGQSENAGWHASTDGAALGPRRLVDGSTDARRPEDRSFDVVQ
jgi:hypothetical protein